jgi:hypothetical protein
MAIAKQRKKLILKTKPYFECKAGHDRELMRAFACWCLAFRHLPERGRLTSAPSPPLPAGLRRMLLEHEESTAAAKKKYRGALKDLEDISAEIHARR